MSTFNIHEAGRTAWHTALAAQPNLQISQSDYEFAFCSGYEYGKVLHATDVSQPIPMLLWCPMCAARHIDDGEFATKPHHTHACQSCGAVWRPAVNATVGVQFLPGFKNGDSHAAR